MSPRSSGSSVRSTAASRPEPILGCETPRIFTPPLRELTPATSLGFAVIEFATDVLDVRLMPWQRWDLIHTLELLPDGSLRFRTVVLLVARQNGKSMLSIVLALFFMYVLGRQMVIGTAQDLDVAEEIWQQAVDLATETDDDDRPVRPDMAELVEKVVNINGKRALVLKTGERYKVKSANRRAGRSLSGDLILLDELREHQSWDAWGAITKTTMARAFALILCLSNAGDASSVVLRYLRVMAHLALGNPDDLDSAGVIEPDDVDAEADGDSLGIFEWSAAPQCAVNDRAGWAQANPALGHTITERAVASAMRTDPEWVFRTEVLCQWNSGSTEGPFPAGAWEACLDRDSTIAAAPAIGVGVDVSADRSFAHICFAGLNQHGALHVEHQTRRAGTDWVAGWLLERADRLPFTGIAVQARGAPASPLVGELELAGLPVRRWEGSALSAASGKFYDLVRNTALRHLAQPALDIAAATAVTKPSGDSWLWNRTGSPTDIAPLVAATAALWALTDTPLPIRSAYEDSGLIVA